MPRHRPRWTSQPNTRNSFRTNKNQARRREAHMSTISNRRKPASTSVHPTHGSLPLRPTTTARTRFSPKPPYPIMSTTGKTALCSTGITSTVCSPTATHRLPPVTSKTISSSSRIPMYARWHRRKSFPDVNSPTGNPTQYRPSISPSILPNEAHITLTPPTSTTTATSSTQKSDGEVSCVKWRTPTSSNRT